MIGRLLILVVVLAGTWGNPVHAQYDFTASDTEGCTPLKVKFTFQSSATADTITSYFWDFGNGQTSTEQDPDTVVYQRSGIFSPTLTLNDQNASTITKDDLISVHKTVQANFRYYDTVTHYTYVLEQTDELDPVATYNFTWNIEDIGTRTGRREFVTFPSVDSFQVVLTVTDNFGCTSTYRDQIIVLEDIVIQNVFTPNGDGINDFFIVTSKGSYPLNIKIFTRTGILVYENEGFTIAWDGRTASGQMMNTGIYYYVLEPLSGDPSNRYTKTGSLYLYK